jgi:hypothetical protein
MAWGGATRHGFAHHTQNSRPRANFDISALPENALDEINAIQIRQPGFIPRRT